MIKNKTGLAAELISRIEFFNNPDARMMYITELSEVLNTSSRMKVFAKCLAVANYYLDKVKAYSECGIKDEKGIRHNLSVAVGAKEVLKSMIPGYLSKDYKEIIDVFEERLSELRSALHEESLSR